MEEGWQTGASNHVVSENVACITIFACLHESYNLFCVSVLFLTHSVLHCSALSRPPPPPPPLSLLHHSSSSSSSNSTNQQQEEGRSKSLFFCSSSSEDTPETVINACAHPTKCPSPLPTKPMVNLVGGKYSNIAHSCATDVSAYLDFSVYCVEV